MEKKKRVKEKEKGELTMKCYKTNSQTSKRDLPLPPSEGSYSSAQVLPDRHDSMSLLELGHERVLT